MKLNPIYNVDILGPSLNLVIFGNENYKSIWSLIWSIIIIIIIVAYSLLTFHNYFQFKEPKLNFYEYNNHTQFNNYYNLSKGAFMFYVFDGGINNLMSIDKIKKFFILNIYIVDQEGIIEDILRLESYEVGKNLNEEFLYPFFLKYDKAYTKADIEKMKKDINISYLCFNKELISKYSLVHKGPSYQRMIYGLIDVNYTAFNESGIDFSRRFVPKILYPNYVLEHYNKENPVSKGLIGNSLYFEDNFFLMTSIKFNYFEFESREVILLDALRPPKIQTGIYVNDISTMVWNYFPDEKRTITQFSFYLNTLSMDKFTRIYDKFTISLSEIFSFLRLIKIFREIIAGITNKNK